MTKEYNLSGTHVVNRWVWKELREELPNDFLKYTTQGTATTPNPVYGLVPIIPSQQLPQFTEIAGGAPFMIYNYSVSMMPELWETRDTLGYVIYDDNEARLRRIHNFMVRLLGRRDWTAADINTWIDYQPVDDAVKEFEFNWVGVDNAAGPQPFESEGGRHGALIMAQVSYKREMYGHPGLLGYGLGMRS